MHDPHTISMNVNGERVQATTDARMHLADFLRRTLRLTGVHIGCEHGVCGACTVLVEGKSVRSCLMLAIQAEGCEILTIEGVASPDALHPVQESLSRHHGLQCGYCTPGVVLTLIELGRDRDGAALSEDEIRHALSGNLCRCTGYQGIVDAALELYGAPAQTQATTSIQPEIE